MAAATGEPGHPVPAQPPGADRPGDRHQRALRRFRPASLADKDRVGGVALGWLTRTFGALPMPDLARYGEAGRKEVEEAIQDCARLLREGGNLVLYPGGHLMSSRPEQLGGNSAVETILQPGARRPGWCWSAPGGCGAAGSAGPRARRTSCGCWGPDSAPAGQLHLLLAPGAGHGGAGEPADLPAPGRAGGAEPATGGFYNEDTPPALHVPLHLLGGGRPPGPARSAPGAPDRGPGGGARPTPASRCWPNWSA